MFDWIQKSVTIDDICMTIEQNCNEVCDKLK